MANVDVELGDVDIIQSTVQSTLLDCVENEKHLPNANSSICMVPSVFRDRSPTSFNPSVVSIGPLHREDKKLQEFEVYKVSTVYKLLHRFESSPPEQTLQLCMQKVKDSIGDIRDCYAGMNTYSDLELAKMMVMDGCFVLEFIYDYSNDRSVVRNKLLEFHIIYDLLLLENQIPFFVLNDIFDVFLKFGTKAPLSNFILPVLDKFHLFYEDQDRGNIGTDTTPHHILDLLHQFYRPQDNKNDLSDSSSSSNYSAVEPDMGNICKDTTPYHILDLLYQCYRPRDDINDLSDSSCSSNYSAVDLDRAGVSFKPHKHANWSLAMDVDLHRIPCVSWFWAKPTLRMPVFQIHDYTELILRNLMAYEQSCLGCSFVTSYVAAMDMLVDTEEDIAMLIESKVLENIIGSNHEAANLINRLCKEIDWTDSFYREQWKKLDSYYNGYWPKHVARLRRTYFSSPWNIIALVAGIVLFGLTVVQTICAIKEVGRG